MSRFSIALTGFFLLIGYSNCMNGGFESVARQNVVAASACMIPQFVRPQPTDNQMAVSVGECGHINQPCVSVTICRPGTEECQTIPNVLLDTGSYGLRLYKEVVCLQLDPVKSTTGQPMGECMSYAGGKSQWGSVQYADVQMGNQTAPKVPIQVIDSSFATKPSSCSNSDDTPGTLGFNGILGVGLFEEDCGPNCANNADLDVYYTCTGKNCVSSVASLDRQVANPVAKLPANNNGVVLRLPSVPDTGAPTVQGSLVIGIGTQSNNTPTAGSVTVMPANAEGHFRTSLNGTTYANAFIDSGSNVIFFPSDMSTTCSRGVGYYCPTSKQSFTATQMGASGSAQKSVSFSIMNADDALDPNNPNWAFSNLGGKLQDNSFDWGLPFFFGRSVYVGIEGRASSIGTGPFWAH